MYKRYSAQHSSIETGELLETVSIIFASYHVIFGKRGDKANTDSSIFLDANSNFPIRLKAKTGNPCLCRTGFPGFRGALPAPLLAQPACGGPFQSGVGSFAPMPFQATAKFAIPLKQKIKAQAY